MKGGKVGEVSSMLRSEGCGSTGKLGMRKLKELRQTEWRISREDKGVKGGKGEEVRRNMGNNWKCGRLVKEVKRGLVG